MNTTAHTPRTRVGMLTLIEVESIKLRRSLVWLFTLLLPLLAVITGSVNYAGNQGVLTQGWESYASQVTIFYGIFFFAVGIALICSAVWRTEHRGTSWNAMRTTPASVVKIAAAKTLTTMVPVVAMQAVLVILTWFSGALVLGLPGGLPVRVAVTGALATLAALPLVALQSLLAMRLQSFGAPVALALAGTIIGVALSSKATSMAVLWPYSLVSKAQSLGATTLATAGQVSWEDISQVLTGTVMSAAVCWGLLMVVSARSARR